MRIAFVAALLGAAMTVGDAVRAQQAEPVVVANAIVARVRDKGDCPNVFARAAKVQQRITECISKKEAGTAKMSLKKEDERWSISCGTTMLIRVWPEDARANGIDELRLAQMWLENFERELPNAEPFRFKLAREGEAAYEQPIKRNPPEADAASNPGPTGDPEATGTLNVLTQPPKRSTELLVVLDSFDIVRTYSKEEYEAKKDVLGQRLIDRLAPFIRGMVDIGEPTAPGGAPLTSPAPGRVEPKLSPGAPIGPPPVPQAPPTLAPTAPEKAAGAPAKMGAVQQPLADMKQRADPQAERVGKLLSVSRSQFYSGEFDASEEAVDAALRILGLQVD